MTPPAPSSGPAGELPGPVAPSGAIRRDIRRANTAVAVVLTAVLAIALVAVFAGLRAARSQRRAEAAETENQERLRTALTEEARAIRVSADAGGRVAALTAISNAVAIRISPELRTEAMACLALDDLAPEGPLVPTAKDLSRLLVDPLFHYYADGDPQGRVLARSLSPERPNLMFDPQAAGCAEHRPLTSLDFSPDGSCLASCLADGTIAVWNLVSSKLVFACRFSATNGLAPTPLRGLAFSDDSRKIIFTDSSVAGQISIYDLASGKRQVSGIKAWGKTFRLRSDARSVALVTGPRVDILNYPAGTIRQTLTLSVPVVTLEWSPDGRRLAVASADGEICLWEPESGAQEHFIGHSEAGIRLGFNSKGTLLFSSSRDGTTRLWDVTLGRMAAVGQGFGCTFSQDDQHINYWKPWDGFGQWRVDASRIFALHDFDKSEGPLYSLDLSPSGRWCVITEGKGVRIWDLTANDRENLVPAEVLGARVAPDEQSLFACGTNGLTVWPLTTNAIGEVCFSPVNSRLISMPNGAGARAVTLSENGRWAVVDLSDRRMVRMDLTGHTSPTLIKGLWGQFNSKGSGSSTGAGRFVVSPDGRWIATGFDFGGAGPKVWNGDTGELVTNLPAGSSVVAFSPDGHWLGLAGISRNSIWSVGDWKLQRNFVRDESSLVHGAMAFLPQEPLVAMSQTRQIVQLRNWQTDETVGNLIAPGVQSINSVRVSADGQTLVMATASDMVEVWRLGELRHELTGMGLNWGGPPPDPAVPHRSVWDLTSGWLMTVAILGGFGLIASVALLTLRRHRMAIERFVVAEAEAAQTHRALDLAKVELMHGQKMQALGTLAAGVAHDFNNLLSVIRMSNKLIDRRAQQDGEIKELTADVEQAVLQGKSVVGSVLGYARNGQANGQPTDVSAVIEETVSLLSREFLSGIALTLDVEREVPAVSIPRGPLEQVLMNLIVNASEAMQGQGYLKISLHLRLQESVSEPLDGFVLRPQPALLYLEMSVRDSGPGIAPENRSRLFEPFFTTKFSGARVGTGLGLSLVYTIAEQAGLGLIVASTLGLGARFTVLIPLEEEPVRETHSVKTTSPA